jgi:thiol-disulfide isomerase/thioredoxin
MLKNFLLLALSVLTLLPSCQTEKTATASLNGKYTGFDQPLTFYVRDHGKELSFNIPTYIDTLVTSADGSFSLTVDATTPKELLLEAKSPDGNGKIYQSVFIEAGDSIYFESDGKFRSPLKNLLGRGSDKLAVMEKTGSLISGMGFQEIIGKKDSAQVLGEFNIRLNRYTVLLDSVKPLFSTAFLNYLTGSKLQETAYFLQILPVYLEVYGYSSFAVDSIDRDNAYAAMYSFSPEGYKNFNFADQLYQLLMSNLPKTDSVTTRINSYLSQVDSLHLPAEGKHLMIGKGILYFLRRGKVKEIEPILNTYYTQHPTSIYTEILKAQFAEWSALSAGKPAPDFTATQLDGKPFKLSDLKGKVVYIDIWATWCGPCRAEFPHATEIKKHYKNNSDIVFLYVSLDGKKETWQKYLSENPTFEGFHVNDPGDFDSVIAKMYKVNGIPRYMVIDREGKIFSTDAKRPSDKEKLIEQLDEALKIKG